MIDTCIAIAVAIGFVWLFAKEGTFDFFQR